MQAGEVGDNAYEQGVNLMEAIIAFAVTEWSFGAPPSQNMDALNDLQVGDYDALISAVDSFQNVMFPPVVKNDPRDPKADSPDSDASS